MEPVDPFPAFPFTKAYTITTVFRRRGRSVGRSVRLCRDSFAETTGAVPVSAFDTVPGKVPGASSENLACYCAWNVPQRLAYVTADAGSVGMFSLPPGKRSLTDEVHAIRGASEQSVSAEHSKLQRGAGFILSRTSLSQDRFPRLTHGSKKREDPLGIPRC